MDVCRLILPLAAAALTSLAAERAGAQAGSSDPLGAGSATSADESSGLPGISRPDPDVAPPAVGPAGEAGTFPDDGAPDGTLPGGVGLDGSVMERSGTPGGIRPDVAGQRELLPGLIDAQIKPCWTVPALSGDPAEGGLARIRVELLPDGNLASPPAIIDKPAGRLGGVFADSAVRAIERCSPFRLPPESYQSWKSLMIVFDTLDF